MKNPHKVFKALCRHFCVLCDSCVGAEEEAGGTRQWPHRHARDPAPGGLDKRIEELEKVRVASCRGVNVRRGVLCRNNHKTASLATSNLQLTFLHHPNYLYDPAVSSQTAWLQ